MKISLPLHPTMRHPLTGEPLRAIYVRRDGRAMWPIMGGAPDDQPGGGDDQPGGGGDDDQPSGGNGNATDAQGRDLGYPANTRTAEMTAEQQAAYWQHQSKKHEGRYKTLAGDRSFDDVKKDLDAYAEVKKSQMTPADQQLTQAREAGKAEALQESNARAATAIFRASLEGQGHKKDDIDDLVDNFNVANFIADGDVDTTKLATFAKKFTPAGTAEQRRRDFGGGNRGGGNEPAQSGGKSEAQRRFQKKTTSTD